MIVKINSDKYIHLFSDIPNTDFIFFNWEYKAYYLWGFPLFIVYNKTLKS